MVYQVIGLMSGSSLDGLDIVFTILEEKRGQWDYKILNAECIPYSDHWKTALKHADGLYMGDFLKLHTGYGKFLGEMVNLFIAKYHLEHSVHFIASHGHTVFHEPINKSTFQLGDGATLAAITGLPIITDLRAIDVALGGQGAPIVPIGDKLLFGQYNYGLNIGGIANLTIKQENQYIAFDVCPANQILNALACIEGKEMDENGAMAAEGCLLDDVLEALNGLPYYKMLPPKSLNNETAMNMIFPILSASQHTTKDLLHTVCHHMAQQICNALQILPILNEKRTLLVTGGGAFNQFLVTLLQQYVLSLQIEPILPAEKVIKYKEALIMALIGTLRWRGETNVMCSVTGATRDSIGGALWMGNS